jgi:hypothetical protein
METVEGLGEPVRRPCPSAKFFRTNPCSQAPPFLGAAAASVRQDVKQHILRKRQVISNDYSPFKDPDRELGVEAQPWLGPEQAVGQGLLDHIADPFVTDVEKALDEA